MQKIDITEQNFNRQKIDISQIEHNFNREIFKTMRSNIHYYGGQKQVIAFTSCNTGEGKSSISFSLGLSYAQSGKRVVFVDADLHKSVLAGRLRAQDIKGLSHFLSGQDELKDIVYKTNNKNFDMVFAGPEPPNPAEMLDSNGFAEMLRLFRTVYDFVIVDTPPATDAVDGIITIKQCDGVVLVVESGEVKCKTAQRIKRALEANCNLLGVVLNKVGF